MTGWIIAGAILLLLFLLSLLRLGVQFTYEASGIRLRLRVGRIYVTLYPRKKKASKRKKSKAKKKTAQPKKPSGQPQSGQAPPKEKPAPDRKPTEPPRPETKPPEPGPKKPEARPSEPTRPKPKQPPKAESKQPEQASGPSIQDWLPVPELISLALEAAPQVTSRLQVDTLALDYTIGGKTDPAWAAVQYGLIYAGEGGLVPLMENSFYAIRDRDIRARVDFDSDDSCVWLRLALSIRVGQLLVLGVRIGRAVYQRYRNYQNELAEGQKQEGNDNGTEASDQ